MATATLVAMKEAAQKKHATIRLVLDTRGIFLDIVTFYLKCAFYSIYSHSSVEKNDRLQENMVRFVIIYGISSDMSVN